MLGHTYAVLGQRSEAQKALVELKEPVAGVYVPPYMVATVYAGLGDKDQAFQCLDQGLEGRSYFLTTLKLPMWDVDPTIRQDPRFQAIFKKVGLPE